MYFVLPFALYRARGLYDTMANTIVSSIKEIIKQLWLWWLWWRLSQKVAHKFQSTCHKYLTLIQWNVNYYWQTHSPSSKSDLSLSLLSLLWRKLLSIEPTRIWLFAIYFVATTIQPIITKWLKCRHWYWIKFATFGLIIVFTPILQQSFKIL